MAGALLAAVPERFTLIGLSLGGYRRVRGDAPAPARVERLALLDTTASADSETARAGRLADIATVEAGGIEALIPQLPGRWLLPRTSGATT
jgi:pimeloyl-ACP methyl ester carboxylesterase